METAIDISQYDEGLDIQRRLRQLDGSLDKSVATFVPTVLPVDKSGNPSGTRPVDWQFNYTGSVTLDGYKSISISNIGAAAVSVDIYADGGAVVANTRSIPTGSSISVQADGFDVLPKMVVDATASMINYGVA